MLDIEEFKKMESQLTRLKFELLGGWKGIFESLIVRILTLLCQGFVFGMGWYFAKSVWE